MTCGHCIYDSYKRYSELIEIYSCHHTMRNTSIIPRNSTALHTTKVISSALKIIILRVLITDDRHS